MSMKLLRKFIRRFTKDIRTFESDKKYGVLTLDGLNVRNRIELLEWCVGKLYVCTLNTGIQKDSTS